MAAASSPAHPPPTVSYVCVISYVVGESKRRGIIIYIHTLLYVHMYVYSLEETNSNQTFIYLVKVKLARKLGLSCLTLVSSKVLFVKFMCRKLFEKRAFKNFVVISKPCTYLSKEEIEKEKIVNVIQFVYRHSWGYFFAR